MKLKSWDETANWIDQQGITYPLSYVSEVITGKYPADSFSLGQLASKIWMISELKKIGVAEKATVAILGSWIGTLVPLLHHNFQLDRVYGFDVDPESIKQSEVINRNFLVNNWSYKGVVADVDFLNVSNMQFVTEGELIETKPDLVINTSCEHMSTDWFDTVAKEQLIAIQSNDNPDFTGHVNTCKDEEDFSNKYPMSKTLYEGKITLPIYTRFMKIGFK